MPHEPGGPPKDIISRSREREDFRGKDFYQILGVERDATREQIDQAFKKRRIQLHPDKHPEDPQHYDELFRSLVEAYDVLRDPARKGLYDFNFDDIFSAAAGHASYYQPATQERINREHYIVNIHWLIELYRKERQTLQTRIYDKACEYAREIEKRFPGCFGAGYDYHRNQWVLQKIRWSELAYPKDEKNTFKEYPKGEKTPDDLIAQELEELAPRYQQGLEAIKLNFRERATRYATLFHQTMPKARVYRTDEKDFVHKKEFTLGNLLVVRKDGSYTISAGGNELPETWDDIIWQDDDIIFCRKADRFFLLNPTTGLLMSSAYEKIEVIEGLIVATAGKKSCIIRKTDGVEVTKRYDILVVFAGGVAQGLVIGEGEYMVEIQHDSVSETKVE